jgi:hypothetical protein
MLSLCGHKVFRTRPLKLVLALKWVILTLCIASPSRLLSAVEERFAVLQIGTRTYRNVTVTTKDKNYIFILHAAGMSNIKIAELTPEVRERLGYHAMPEPRKKGTSAASAWAKSAIAKIEIPHLKNLPHSLVAARAAAVPSNLPPNILLTAAAIGIGSFLLFCYCSMMICKKTGNDPGVLIWIPVLQIFPLLRAASMPAGWFFAFVIPIFNVIAFIAWSINIAQARGKSGWVALWLLLPITNFLAYLYLAFSSGTPVKTVSPRRMELMTLEAA